MFGNLGVWVQLAKIKLYIKTLKKKELEDYVISVLSSVVESREEKRIVCLTHSNKIKEYLVEIDKELDVLDELTAPIDFEGIRQEYIIEDIEKVYIRWNKLRGKEYIELQNKRR